MKKNQAQPDSKESVVQTRNNNGDTFLTNENHNTAMANRNSSDIIIITCAKKSEVVPNAAMAAHFNQSTWTEAFTARYDQPTKPYICGHMRPHNNFVVILVYAYALHIGAFAARSTLLLLFSLLFRSITIV